MGRFQGYKIISNALAHESNEVEKIPLHAGDIAVFDRGYNNYKYFAKLCRDKVSFVTRIKSNATYTVVNINQTGNSKTILSDETIELNGFYAKQNCPFYLRKITSLDPITGKEIDILTNHLDWSASTIAAIYKDRWQIELFFKAIKQNLKIKRFYGTSKNAVHTQIWIALITFLLFCILKFRTKTTRTFTCFISVFPTVIFQRRSLLEWFSDKLPDNPTSLNLYGQLALL